MSDDLRKAAYAALTYLDTKCAGRCDDEPNPCYERQLADALSAALAARDERVAQLEAFVQTLATYPRTRGDERAMESIRKDARALLAPPAPPAPDDGWIAWEGGDCPVDPDCIVEARGRYSGGATRTTRAENLCWDRGAYNYVTAYRIAPPATKEPT